MVKGSAEGARFDVEGGRGGEAEVSAPGQDR